MLTAREVRTNCLETGHGSADGEPQAFRCAAGATAVGDGLGGTGGGMKMLRPERSSTRMLRDRVMEAEALLEQGCRWVGASQIASRAYTDWHGILAPQTQAPQTRYGADIGRPPYSDSLTTALGRTRTRTLGGLAHFAGWPSRPRRWSLAPAGGRARVHPRCVLWVGAHEATRRGM
jgi:hypothetical protein